VLCHNLIALIHEMCEFRIDHAFWNARSKLAVMPMEAVRQKIARSREHLKSVETEIKGYFEKEPCRVVAEFDTNSNRVVGRFVVTLPVPDSIPIILGDALQNLRSSLDYLVWELVLAANGSPGKKHMFPICTSLDAFHNEISRGRLDGVATAALAEIQGLQPYHMGQDAAASHVLAVLDSFCNINKHRRILLTALATHFSRTEIVSSTLGRSIQTTLTPRYHDTELFASHAVTEGRETMEMQGDAFFFVTFNEGAAKDIEIATCTNQIWRIVNEDLIPRFERFFI
jgi:hypothetical protein